MKKTRAAAKQSPKRIPAIMPALLPPLELELEPGAEEREPGAGVGAGVGAAVVQIEGFACACAASLVKHTVDASGQSPVVGSIGLLQSHWVFGPQVVVHFALSESEHLAPLKVGVGVGLGEAHALHWY